MNLSGGKLHVLHVLHVQDEADISIGVRVHDETFQTYIVQQKSRNYGQGKFTTVYYSFRYFYFPKYSARARAGGLSAANAREGRGRGEVA